MPASDDLDRDKLYSAGTNEDEDDGADYELEPPDPAVLAAEKQRGAEALRAHKKAIDVDEVFRDQEARRDTEILEDWLRRLRNIRFQVKHLLILTAVVAIVLALRHWINVGKAFVIAIMVAVAGVTLYLQWQEKKRQDEVDRRRHRMYAERQAHLGRQGSKPTETADIYSADDVATEPLPPNPLDEVRRHAAAARQFRFQFSLKQLLIAITGAAVALGLVGILGGAAYVATLCGFFALAGLVIHACGYEPPEIVVFGWWVLLVLYVVLNILSEIWAGLGGA